MHKAPECGICRGCQSAWGKDPPLPQQEAVKLYIGIPNRPNSTPTRDCDSMPGHATSRVTWLA